MTDEEAMRDAWDKSFGEYSSHPHVRRAWAEAFAAGLRHARQWRELTADPASWPAEGQEVVVLWRDMRTSTATCRAIRGANAFETLITHWILLPSPPEAP